MTEEGSELAVSRRVVIDVVRMAAAETGGVAQVRRAGRWRRLFRRRPIEARIHDGSVTVVVHIIARSGTQLEAVGEAVRSAVAAAIPRVLGLGVGSVTVVVDGVGG